MVVQMLDGSLEKVIWVSDRTVRLPSKRMRKSFWSTLLHPGEPPFAGTAVYAIEVEYPLRTIHVFGWRIHWLVIFFGLSMAFGFVFKRIFRVEV